MNTIHNAAADGFYLVLHSAIANGIAGAGLLDIISDNEGAAEVVSALLEVATAAPIDDADIAGRRFVVECRRFLSYLAK